MLVDHEAVLLGLKEYIATKPHHGQRELAVVIARLEVQNRIEEGLPERTLRLYGLEFFEEAVRGPYQPSSSQGSVSAADGSQVRALRGAPHKSEEDTHGSTRRSAAGSGRANGTSGARSGRAASRV